MKELKKLVYIIAIFLGCFYMPIESLRFDNAIFEALALVKWYAREHVLLCLVPAFFIAGAIAVFVNQASVIKYFGAKANKMLSYGVASVSGVILAVCSCTILPLFSGIYRRGAGLGPAIAFLYSGPAINVLAIILTARILGWKIGLARAIGAIAFSIVIGFIMHLIFIKEEHARHAKGELQPGAVKETRPLWKSAIYFFSMIAVLVFANSGKWWITGFFLAAVVAALASWFKKDEIKDWVSATWAFALQILPLLLGGVLISGFLLGRVGHEGIIPSRYVAALVGGNSLFANFFSSIVGAFMYFATLTEVPIVQGLMASGMGKGPALALLLAGPALSLPSMLVIRGVIGTKKTAVYVVLVVIMATISGVVFGLIAE
ncbi:MAG: permease [Candidatus Omnitrophota bacterium]